MMRSIYAEILLPLSTRLANGEILFVCDNTDSENWIQAYAFYQFRGGLYAMTKDFAGIFHRPPYQPSNSFIECRAYFLSSGSTIVNLNGEVIATCGTNCQWTLALPGTKLLEAIALRNEVARQIQCNQEINKTCNNYHKNNIEPPQRLSLQNFYQWVRSVFTNKRPAVG